MSCPHLALASLRDLSRTTAQFLKDVGEDCKLHSGYLMWPYRLPSPLRGLKEKKNGAHTPEAVSQAECFDLLSPSPEAENITKTLPIRRAHFPLLRDPSQTTKNLAVLPPFPRRWPTRADILQSENETRARPLTLVTELRSVWCEARSSSDVDRGSVLGLKGG